METDAFFCQLFKQLPQTLFELLGQPPEQARGYRFDSVELKKALRIDGLFLPRKPNLPLYFVEVQFRRLPNFYANLFAKVFCYLEENDPTQDWVAVAVFPSRRMEPRVREPYEDLLQSRRVCRVYLNEYPQTPNPPLGLGILQLMSAPLEQAKPLVRGLLHKAEYELAGTPLAEQVVQLVEELLLRRFPELNREEIRAMFELEDLRKSRVWQEAHDEGREEGREEGRAEGREEGRAEGREEGQTWAKKDMVHKLLAKGMRQKEIATLLDLSVQEVRRLAAR